MMNKYDQFRTRISRYLRRTQRWMIRKGMKHITLRIVFIHNGRLIEKYDTPIQHQMNNRSIISIANVVALSDENESNSQDTVILDEEEERNL